MTQQNRRTVKPFNRSTIQHVKAYAFTLAEVLIVIGIIGVVAALTLPNLNHATGDRETVTRVKKIYSTLNEAYDRAQVVYGSSDSWCDYAEKIFGDSYPDYACSNLFLDRIAKFMKVAKVNDNHNDDSNEITLQDGTNFCIYIKPDPNPSKYHYGESDFGCILVDIDGFKKGKNIDGVDWFKFDITEKGIYPEGIVDSKIFCLYNAKNCVGESSGSYGATRWILENDNADYLKVNDSGKCNDSDIVLDWNTNTSCH